MATELSKRQTQILSLVREQGTCSVADLARLSTFPSKPSVAISGPWSTPARSRGVTDQSRCPMNWARPRSSAASENISPPNAPLPAAPHG